MAMVGRSFSLCCLPSQAARACPTKPSILRPSFSAVAPLQCHPPTHRPRAPSSFSFFRCVRGMASSENGVSRDGQKSFPLSSTCLLKLQRGDITKWSVDGTSDAIVNAANERMLGGGGVDGAIHRAAGPELREACWNVPEVRPGVRCPTGEARITGAYRLPVSRVIHTVGPVYDIDEHPEASLRSVYRNCLRIAKENHIQYIAFPAISCGVFRYPLSEASYVAVSTVKEFADDFKEIHFVLFSDDAYNAWLEKANEVL
ncbi:Macro domain-containing protein [Nymphaea thermarum]|nr:Macro domain-containing protein [Nymphaea thermarum]